jgi:hypothetical protein
MRKFFVVVFATILTAFSAYGQTATGGISGIITSPDGGVIQGATVEAKFNQTGKSYSAVTGDDGAFQFSQLEPGNYTLTVTASGFKVLSSTDVKIDIGREYNFNRTLEVGAVTETVTVTAGADVITSNSAQITSVVSPQQILSLPLLARNPLNLTTLQAGVQSNPFQGTSINGQRTTLTNITRDGISINDQFIRANATDFAPGRPSVDDTGEFTISTSNQESDTGSGGAQIILVTPRGTSDFHGALFAYNRNSRFAANNFFNNRTPNINGVQQEIAKKPPFRNRNQYGGKVSGPFPTPMFGEGTPYFRKNKGFFFFAYEGIKDPLAQRYTRTILTPAARNGTFTFNRANAGNVINANGISCPDTVAGSICTVTNILTFAQGQGILGIPNAINPIIQAQVLAPMPTAGNTTGGDGLNTTGYGFNRRFDTTRKTYTTRIDVDITSRDALTGVYSWNKENVLRPDVDTANFSEVPDVTQYSKNKTLSVTYRRVISNTMVNELRYGIFTSEVPFARISPYPEFFLGPQGTTSGTLAGLVEQPNIFLDQGRNNKLYNWADNFNWIVGKHSLKFGGQLQLYKVNSYNDVLIVPNYIIGPSSVVAPGVNNTNLTTGNFANNCTPACTTSLISGAQATTASNFLALMAGIVNQRIQGFNTATPSSGYAPVRNLSPFRNSNHALYVSDRWSAARGLTISAGVRWEIYPAMKINNGLSLEPVISNPDDPAASLLAGNGTYNVVGTNAGTPFLYYKTDYNNFAPAFGVAWSPNPGGWLGRFFLGTEGQTVIRGGYSQAYGNDSIITSLNGTLVANVGLGRASNSAIGPLGTTVVNDRLGGNNTPIGPPIFVNPPRSFLQNNTAGQGFFGVANAVDPKLQIPRTDQYSFGIQREFWGNTVVEARYVGTRSDNLARGIDLNEIDVVNNGFLADFIRAQSNLAISIAANGGNINNATPFCNNPGCVPLTIFQNGGVGAPGRLVVGTGVTLATLRTQLQGGTVADLAQLFVAGNLNNHPTLAAPGLVPFVSFYRNPNIGQIELFTNAGSFKYNSLQLEMRRRFSQGLYFQVNYTYSKNVTDTVGTSQQLFEPYLQNNRRELDEQRADFDQTHTFNFNGIYQLPFGKGKMFMNKGGLWDKVFGGWELSGLMQWSTGAPISFVDTRGTLNRGVRSGRQTPFSTLSSAEIRALSGIFEANGRIYFLNPSVIGTNGAASTGYIYPGLSTNTSFTGQMFFNLAPGQTGNIGRTLINGPRSLNVNAALLKSIRFTESMRIQLRAEAFNVLNNVNLRNNTQLANINSTTFGQITSAADARILQFAARFEF